VLEVTIIECGPLDAKIKAVIVKNPTLKSIPFPLIKVAKSSQ